jgi:hypothetical protein
MLVIGGITASCLQLAGCFNHYPCQGPRDNQHPVKASDPHVMDISWGVADDHVEEENQTQTHQGADPQGDHNPSTTEL